MKCVVRCQIYMCLVLLAGCGYVFDPEAFTFVKVPVDAVSTNTQEEQSLSAVEASPTAEPAARRNENRRRDNDRSSPRSDDAPSVPDVNTTAADVSSPPPDGGSGDLGGGLDVAGVDNTNDDNTNNFPTIGVTQ